MSESKNDSKNVINSFEYYNEWHGHLRSHLNIIHDHFEKQNKSFIYLAGDSSLDNKYWIGHGCGQHKTLPGYKEILSEPRMKADIAFNLNSFLFNYHENYIEFEDKTYHEKLKNYVAINCACEATTLQQRVENYNNKSMFAQDEFIVDNITNEDILVVSIGGNDIALDPSVKTAMNMLLMTSFMNSIESIKEGRAYGFSYFQNYFQKKTEKYIKQLVSKRKPKMVLVCMIYYPDENEEVSTWAQVALSTLKYNSQPEKLQAAINAIYEKAIKEIKIDGVKIVPVPLFGKGMLDGKETSDYVARVEPSESGGKKMALGLYNEIYNNLDENFVDDLKSNGDC